MHLEFVWAELASLENMCADGLRTSNIDIVCFHLACMLSSITMHTRTRTRTRTTTYTHIYTKHTQTHTCTHIRYRSWKRDTQEEHASSTDLLWGGCTSTKYLFTNNWQSRLYPLVHHFSEALTLELSQARPRSSDVTERARTRDYAVSREFRARAAAYVPPAASPYAPWLCLDLVTYLDSEYIDSQSTSKLCFSGERRVCDRWVEWA